MRNLVKLIFLGAGSIYCWFLIVAFGMWITGYGIHNVWPIIGWSTFAMVILAIVTDNYLGEDI
jgi:hypothetical protein